MTARNVVPETVVEQRGFLRRRRTDETPVPPSTAPVASVVEQAGPPEQELAPAPAHEALDLARAQAALLQAALRKADELGVALASERQAVGQLLAENELLRNALAGLHEEALVRQQAAAPPRQGRRRSAREAGPA